MKEESFLRFIQKYAKNAKKRGIDIIDEENFIQSRLLNHRATKEVQLLNELNAKRQSLLKATEDITDIKDWNDFVASIAKLNLKT